MASVNDERNEAIFIRILNGEKIREVGGDMGLSNERIRAIFRQCRDKVIRHLCKDNPVKHRKLREETYSLLQARRRKDILLEGLKEMSKNNEQLKITPTTNLM